MPFDPTGICQIWSDFFYLDSSQRLSCRLVEIKGFFTCHPYPCIQVGKCGIQNQVDIMFRLFGRDLTHLQGWIMEIDQSHIQRQSYHQNWNSGILPVLALIWGRAYIDVTLSVFFPPGKCLACSAPLPYSAGSHTNWIVFRQGTASSRQVTRLYVYASKTLDRLRRL